jgi:hypothetical protein
VSNPKHDALAAIEGLTLANVLQFFANKASERDERIAAMVKIEDEEFECDYALISESEDNGAYVMGWRWVSFDGVEGLDKNPEESEAS